PRPEEVVYRLASAVLRDDGDRERLVSLRLRGCPDEEVTRARCSDVDRRRAGDRARHGVGGGDRLGPGGLERDREGVRSGVGGGEGVVGGKHRLRVAGGPGSEERRLGAGGGGGGVGGRVEDE